EAAGVIGTLAGKTFSRCNKSIRRARHGFNALRVCGRLALAVYIEQRDQGRGERRDNGKLFVLILGHEAINTYDPGDFWQFFETRDKRWDGSKGWCEDINGVGVRARIVREIQESGNRFDLWAAQIERIEVETEVPEQRGSRKRGQYG